MQPAERAARAAAYERARPEILEHVPRTANRVLDLGCASGTTGAALKTRDPHIEVVGVELEPAYARAAESRLDRVIIADVQALDPGPLGDFDVLIAADILEHLPDPWGALRRYAGRLRPGATVVVSLPNVGHWSTYAALAQGSWPRRPEGIFDATHLRWFTLRDARALLEQAEIRPHTVVRRPWIAWRGSRYDALAVPLLKLPAVRTLVTFQHVIAGIYAPAACR
jgi:2-polyprenyl-3-methyl-5-hydroxy-6-metoxy-1,4-benzoquinol methylase